MPAPRTVAVTVGTAGIAIGLLLFLTMLWPLQLAGFFLCVFGAVILVYLFCQVMKSDQLTVPGHFLLHPRTGTRYTPHQAMAIQRRLDRIRRAAEEEEEPRVSTVSAPPSPSPGLPLPLHLPLPPQHPGHQSLPHTPHTPPPWDMEPPPPYEAVVKDSQIVPATQGL
ncbi:uncharacterized protein si:dkeyp-51f12.3 [Engraulis encrasicolus]|uniref:uncharacterized protein si:dkeyp-51f12.3 n=1 Tax=Engraulis encrasicolus TaxID=184585 RepID=UPI002FD04B4D